MSNSNEEVLITHIKKNQNQMYRLAYSYLNNEADAKDAIQNAIIKAFKGYPKLKNKEILSTWLYRILVNECNDMLRKKKRTRCEVIDEEMIDDKANTTQKTLQEEQIKYLLAKMDPNLKMIIILHFFEDKTLNEIALMCDEPLSTIKSRFYRGLELLRLQMKTEDYL